MGEIAYGQHVIQARDVHIGDNKEKRLFILRSSKTHCGSIQSVKISATQVKKGQGGTFCPYHLLKQYLKVHVKYQDLMEPFFVYRNRAPVLPSTLNKVLKTTLMKCGIESKNFSMHGMRAGRAGDLLKLGVSVETIQKLGRWKLNCSLHIFMLVITS